MELSDGPIWRDIKGCNGKYQVSYYGEFRRVYKSGKVKAMTPYLKTKINGSKRLVVKLTINSKSKEVMAHQVVAETFNGACPNGYVPYHKNGLYTDNMATNIEYISRKQLGKLTGSQSRRKSVCKLDFTGEIVDVYPSARDAGRKNFMSYQTVMDRCNNKVKGAFAPDGYEYAWEDDARSVNNAIKRMVAEVV